MKSYKIFAINPGSTSTKIALFKNEEMFFSKNVAHDAAQLSSFKELSEQLPYRKDTILNLLKESGISLEGTDAFVGRGGGLLSMEGGTYEVDDTLLDHARRGENGVIHPANLGSQIAHEFKHEYGGSAFVVNPPDIDEFQEVARITGVKEIFRTSHIHALNQKETAMHYAALKNKKYEALNLVVAHIGGGISVAAHRGGKMIDGNDNVGGDGPMAPTRAGSLPAADLIRLCFSGKHTQKELLGRCMKDGGFVDHLGTADVLEILKRINGGDTYASIVYNAMIYQIIKAVGAMAAALEGKVDGILLGGGLVNDKELVKKIEQSCSFIAPVTAYPGEFEMEAMAGGALRVLKGKEIIKKYSGIPAWPGFKV
ncbi:MAG: butyrate kinase [Treponema sp.]|jgi:butyrate kinase|nr:butyrate kinase [Treponema sp.]